MLFWNADLSEGVLVGLNFHLGCGSKGGFQKKKGKKREFSLTLNTIKKASFYPLFYKIINKIGRKFG